MECGQFANKIMNHQVRIHRRLQMNKNKIMMILFIASEAMFFVILILGYVYYHAGAGSAAAAKYLDPKLTGLFTALLLASSATIGFAHRGLRRGNTRSLTVWLLATIALGGIFLLGQGREYARLINMNVTISRDVIGSAFFTLTGFHGFHVLLGLITLSIVYALIHSRRFKSLGSVALESAAIYWHFVDAVWIVVFSVVYIGALL